MYEFKLPDVGEGIHEAEILAWRVKAGDTVKRDQPLLEIQTDKAVVEIPSPVGGTIAEIRAEPGQVATVGQVLVVTRRTKNDPRRCGCQSWPPAACPGRSRRAQTGPGVGD